MVSPELTSREPQRFVTDDRPHSDQAPPPIFIDFEGIDGSGKTTLSNRLADFLEEQGIPVHHARSGGVFRSEISQEIRLLTRDPRFLRMSDTTELLLYVARDTQMIDEYIRPKLRPGNIVFSDRYLYSAITHSHFARGVPRDQVDAVLEVAARGLWPHLVVYCDVDPLTSRVRKKIQKIRDKRPLGDFGRKGLMGIGFREDMRTGFLELAKEDPERWIVIDNANSTIETSLQRIFERVVQVLEAKGYKRIKNPGWADLRGTANQRPQSSLERRVKELMAVEVETERRRAACSLFFEELHALVDSNPSRAGLHLLGVKTPEAHQLRELLVEKEPAIVAYSLRGVKSSQAMELRMRLKDVEPAYVARSLFGSSPSVVALRKELAEKVPAYVALSVRGSDTEHAWEIREQIGEKAIREVLISLRGIDSERAWELREKYAAFPHCSALLESLGGIDSERAWQWRIQLSEEYLPWVLMSLRGVFSDVSWELRDEHIARAPKIVVKTLGRSNDPRAWEIRESAKLYAKEVLDSLSGLDNAPAWRLRFDLKEKWPNTCVSSVGAGVQSERAWKFRWDMLDANRDNLLLLKHVLKGALRSLDPVDDEDEEEDEDFT